MVSAKPESMRERVVRYRVDRSLTGDQAAARITAYLYGNIVVFATTVPLTTGDAVHGHAVQLLLGVAVSTYLAHVFSEIVGHQARAGEPMTRAGIWHEIGDSRPIVSSALVPGLLLAAAWAGWTAGDTAILLSEIYLLIRLALVGFLLERLRSQRPSIHTFVAGLVLAAVAAGIALIKVYLGH
ncbi:hypothetical protein [Actinoplanes rectilineatus]|uniref:hypothetical protein n=1 Tax=Actinoplanes rectilineatus TaxID=113571 RepID=UPI000697C7F0|nr:hypothetical protein [Actinoplanes rectilineatus]